MLFVLKKAAECTLELALIASQLALTAADKGLSPKLKLCMVIIPKLMSNLQNTDSERIGGMSQKNNVDVSFKMF